MKTPEGIIILLIPLLTRALLSLACNRAEYQIGQECCPMCPAGTRVNKHCTKFRGTSCLPCDEGTYMDEPTGTTQCFRCRICTGSGLKVKTSCSSISNAVCEPQDGFFCVDPLREGNCEEAQRHKICEPGQFIQQPGSSSVDAVCSPCSEGTFSNGSLLWRCLPHTQCEKDQVIVKAGTLESDTECGQGNPAPIIAIVLGALVAAAVSVIAVIIWAKKKRLCCPNGVCRDGNLEAGDSAQCRSPEAHALKNTDPKHDSKLPLSRDLGCVEFHETSSFQNSSLEGV